MELDEIDLHLLKELQRDCSRSAGSFVEQLGLSQPAIWRRIKRFYEEGIIRRQIAGCDKPNCSTKEPEIWRRIIPSS